MNYRSSCACVAAVCAWMVCSVGVRAQAPVKEYIRLGGRVIAIDSSEQQAQVATPIFSPAAGTYATTQNVSITSTPGATIHYTTNGNTPTTSSPVYSSPIAVSSTQTLKALAVKTGMVDSAVATASYVISTTVPGSGVYDDRDSRMVYAGTWNENNDPGLFANTQSFANVANSSVSFTFNGTAVSYVYTMSNNLGYANVYIDNVLKGTLDQYLAPTGNSVNFVWQKLETFKNLSAGNHTIKVVATGNKNSAAIDSFISVDAFIVGVSTNDTGTGVSYGGSWSTNTGPFWEGDQHYSNVTNATVSFTFTGPFVTYVYAPFPTMAIASVTIDGTSYGTIDQYCPSQIFQASKTFPGLGAGSHTMTITVTGTKNGASSDRNITVDRFLTEAPSSGGTLTIMGDTAVAGGGHVALSSSLAANWTITSGGGTLTLTSNTTATTFNAPPTTQTVTIQAALASNPSVTATHTISVTGAVSQAPSVIANPMSPIYSTTAPFSYVVQDINGYSDIQLVLSGISKLSALGNFALRLCESTLHRPSNTFQILDPVQGVYVYGTPGQTLSNPYCTVSNSYFVPNQSQPTCANVGMSLTAKNPLAGTTHVVNAMAIDNAFYNSGYVPVTGTWTIPTIPTSNQPPTIQSITPTTGTGSSAIFTTVYRDPNGFEGIDNVRMLINSTSDGANACLVAYIVPGKAFVIRNDSNTDWSFLSTVSDASNAQCTLHRDGTSVSGSGTDLTVNWNISFKTAFAGAKNVYHTVVDLGNLPSSTTTAWSTTNLSVSPSSTPIPTPNQTFQFEAYDPNGIVNIPELTMLFNYALDGYKGCLLRYIPSIRRLELASDSNTTIVDSFYFNANGTVPTVVNDLINSQCRIRSSLITSQLSTDGKSFTLRVPIEFSPTLAGPLSIFMGSPSWQLVGNWIAATAQPGTPQLLSYTATPNSGTSADFTMILAHTNPDYFSSIQFLLNTPGSLQHPGGCSFRFASGGAQTTSINEAGTDWNWPQSVSFGTTNTTGTSRCNIDAANSSWVAIGNTVQLKIRLNFGSSFVGIKQPYIYLIDRENQPSGWLTLSPTFTVTSFGVSPPVITALGQGEMGKVLQVTAPSGTAWTATPSASWMQITSGQSGTGSGQIVYNVSSTTSARTGTITVTPASAPAAVVQVNQLNPPTLSVSPASASVPTLSQTFQFAMQHPLGISSVTRLYILVSHGLLDGMGSCWMSYYPASRQFTLDADDRSSSPGFTFASNGTVAAGTNNLSNSQCSIQSTQATFQLSGDGKTITLSIPIAFSSAFIGPKNIYMAWQGADTPWSDWTKVGSWVAVAATAGVPQFQSFSEIPTSGSSGEFTFVVAHSTNPKYFDHLVFNVRPSSVPGYANSCAFIISPDGRYARSINDAGTEWAWSQTGLTFGNAATTGNSQCTLDLQNSTLTQVGNTVTVKLRISFATAFSGVKQSYLFLRDKEMNDASFTMPQTFTVTP